MSFITKTLVAAMALASIASAHMVINTPVPINAASLDNSPLDASGSDFPCKFGDATGYEYLSSSKENTYSVGSADNKLAFTGSAVHGGGSCQISLTYDRPPTKDSVWKVVTSIEGGCPARDTTGNFAADSASYDDPYTYNFTIPDGLESGQYTLAWTWFNKIGNREMYMNCALVTLEGSGGSKDTYNALPDMMVANIDNGCATLDSMDVQFPDPGENLFLLNGATSAFHNPTGSCGSTGASSSSSSSSSSSFNAGSGYGFTSKAATTSVVRTSTAATYAKTTTAPSHYGSGAGNGGAFLESPASTQAPAVTSPAAITSKAAATTKVAATSTSKAASITSATSAASTASGSAYTAGAACTNEGAWNCISGSSFQRCASGTWSAVMQMSSGLTCSSGVSAQLSYTASSRVKRALRLGAKMLRI